MKKIKSLLIIFVLVALMPFVANAKEAVNVYIFKGKTCGYCARALDFFTELKKDSEYGELFNLVEYEVWYNEENSKLAQAVAKKFDEELDGVPYIIIGKKTFSGYTESYNDGLKKAIKDYYNTEKREDVVANVLKEGKYNVTAEDGTSTESSSEVGSNNYSTSEKKNTDTIIAVGIIAVAVLGFGYIIYLSRKEVEEEPKKSEVKKEIKEEKIVVEEEAKEKEEVSKTTSPKKKNTNKNKKKSKK